MRKRLYLFLCFAPFFGQGQSLQTPFEKSAGMQTATYAECIAFYRQLDALSPQVSIKEMGMSDAGLSLSCGAVFE